MNIGKLPPQAQDLEEVVLGSIMLESGAIDEVADILTPEMLYNPSHNEVYKCILKLYSENNPIDLSSVSESLRKAGKLDSVGGAMFLIELMDRIVATSSLEYHARIISQKYIQRELIKTSSKTIKACYDDTDDIFDIISESELERDKMLDQITTRKEVTNAELVKSTIAEIKRTLNTGNDITGVPSDLREVDLITGGWQPSDLIILAARPGMGKSALALVAAKNAAKNKKPVAFFSLEMSNPQLMNRLLAIESEIPLEAFRKKRFSDYEIKTLEIKQREVEKLDIFWDDTPALSVTELRAKCRKLKRRYGIELIVIDYLQLMTVGGQFKGNREQEIGFISRSLKGIAKELNVPVIALSQLSRGVESRPDKRPMLSDLRESGSIEQDADMVTFLYRPEYYGLTEKENGDGLIGVAEFIIAKHRNGSLDDVELKFIGKTTNFVNPDHLMYRESEGAPEGFALQPNRSFDAQYDDNPF